MNTEHSDLWIDVVKNFQRHKSFAAPKSCVWKMRHVLILL